MVTIFSHCHSAQQQCRYMRYDLNINLQSLCYLSRVMTNSVAAIAVEESTFLVILVGLVRNPMDLHIVICVLLFQDTGSLW